MLSSTAITTLTCLLALALGSVTVDANAAVATRSSTGPHGAVHGGSTSCADKSCTSQGSTTTASGATASHTGTSSCANGSCASTATRSGFRGRTSGRSGTLATTP